MNQFLFYDAKFNTLFFINKRSECSVEEGYTLVDIVTMSYGEEELYGDLVLIYNELFTDLVASGQGVILEY